MVTRVTRFSDVFRRANASFPSLRGMVVEGKVEKYMEGNKFVSVSTGLKGSTQFIADELQIPGKALKVGSSRRFIVQRMEDPLGDLELNMSKLLDDQRATNIWAEIKAANERQQPVMGRVLNAVNGGYAVGIAGHVAFLPKTRVARGLLRTGRLQPFAILSRDDTTKNLVVAMPGVNPYQRTNRPVPLKPTGGWSKYLQSMNDSSPTSPPTPPTATIAPTPTSS